MDSYIVNALEQRLGVDLNGDGYIGGEGYLSMLERATRMDFNGDGIIGRPLDVVPGYPAIYGYPAMRYGYGMYTYPSSGYGFTGFHRYFK